MTNTIPTPPLSAVFTNNLKRFVQQSGMTQKSLAEKTGVSENAITKLLRGTSQVRFETVDRLADGLGIDRLEFYKAHER